MWATLVFSFPYQKEVSNQQSAISRVPCPWFCFPFPNHEVGALLSALFRRVGGDHVGDSCVQFPVSETQQPAPSRQQSATITPRANVRLAGKHGDPLSWCAIGTWHMHTD